MVLTESRPTSSRGDVAEVKTSFSKNLPDFMGRPGHFNQALINLFSNAIEAVENWDWSDWEPLKQVDK